MQKHLSIELSSGPRGPKLALVAIAIWSSLFTSAFATAPADQIVTPDPPGQSLYSVVDFTVAGANSDNGTGSIIAKSVDANGIGHFCVLTAHHVLGERIGGVAVNRIAVGSNGGVAPPAAQILPFNVVATRGSSGTEDLAIVDATVGNVRTNPAARAVYQSVKPLLVADPRSRPLRVGDLFTEYGYGNTGAAVNDPTRPAGQQDGYSSVNSSFVKRFQNNTVTNITANIAAPNTNPFTGLADYVEEQVYWNTVAPANLNGYGTSFGGDSGGPYLSSFPSNITVNRGGGNVNILNLTEYIVAVHVWGTTVQFGGAPTKFNGMQNAGVYIDLPDYRWIRTSIRPCVPEPSSLGLLLAGGFAMLIHRRYVKRGPCHCQT